MKGPDGEGREAKQDPLSSLSAQRINRGVSCPRLSLANATSRRSASYQPRSSRRHSVLFGEREEREATWLGESAYPSVFDITIDTVLANQISPTRGQHHRPTTQPCLCRVRRAYLVGEGGYVGQSKILQVERALAPGNANNVGGMPYTRNAKRMGGRGSENRAGG